ncbi:MAG: glutamine--tRNA ligase/YqeY domain fusion protein [Candidatus Heimdallarchaeota archaeon]|nr:MAG: glutamine--tRNA ligase/YqeY domain fusion protein [Candidatus Heimdallarchaeota archaeon]
MISPNSEKDHLGKDFIRKMISEDVKNNKNNGRVHTRFPPEPNGWLHIGHAKSIHLNFTIAEEFNGLCNLRFDDTDPAKESMEYVEAIKKDVQWLGFDWEDRLYFASDYFEQLYQFAIELIKAGKAYICDLSVSEIKEQRGTSEEPGIESPYRNRSVEENIDLFERMRKGEFEDGSRVLRAKIDMTSPNMLMRDPIMYRIKREAHYRTGNDWVIYPSYDYTHGQSDAIEGITHSLCSLEFETHRPLYNWYRDQLLTLNLLKFCPEQTEFSRLNLTYTVMSKRRLLELVEGGHVSGWDDPRMPTLAGLRRRGLPPEAIRRFLAKVGISKRENYIDVGLLESCIREELDETCKRVMAVLRPLKVIILNYPEGVVEELEASNHPKDSSMGSRKIPFSRILYIERDDFLEDPPKKFYRLAPGREVRLRYAYFIKCVDVIKDGINGEIKEVHVTYDPETKGGFAPDGRKVKATLHWVSANHAIPAEARLYDRLFIKENPMDDANFIKNLNTDSLEKLTCFVESSLVSAAPGMRYQFERLGYFCVDSVDSSGKRLVFNRTITLRDTWSKLKQSQKRMKK